MSVASCEEQMDDDQEYSDEEDAHNYYDDGMDDLQFERDKLADDPEHFKYEILEIEAVERLLNESVESVCQAIHVAPTMAKLLLMAYQWQFSTLISRYRLDPNSVLVEARVQPPAGPPSTQSPINECPICVTPVPAQRHLLNLPCKHAYCRTCWTTHVKTALQRGLATHIECMATGCGLRASEDFVETVLRDCPAQREKFRQFSFRDMVSSHSELRFCTGVSCPMVIRAAECKAKRVECSACSSVFCFRCGLQYHAPTDCGTINKWLTKCKGDSETYNYITVNTKDCPSCHVCIEKNGGCNHMQCFKCKHEFCWMCLGDWKKHGSEYYECSRYKENPNIANEASHVQAREALTKYLHYYHRWDNHGKSLRLEVDTVDKIKARIEERVMAKQGTWIDWQYLLTSADTLKKCRYTLQYTYPYAYYLPKGPRKDLFEYQQAQLEAEVENLSWKIERADLSYLRHRGDVENQMDICEKSRLNLIRDFLDA